jgi:hypothetical protein
MELTTSFLAYSVSHAKNNAVKKTQMKNALRTFARVARD